MASDAGAEPADTPPDGGMYYDRQHRYYLPLGVGGPAPHHGQEEDETTGARESLRDVAVPRFQAVAICAALAFVLLLACGYILPKPLVELAAIIPVLFVEYVVSVLQTRKIRFPAPVRAVFRRRILNAIGYALALLFVADVEGLILRAAGGSVSELALLNIGTAITMGALIGWRKSHDAIWIIVEASYVASLLGGFLDLRFLGSQRFEQVHAGVSLVVVVVVSGTVFAAGGIAGYLGQRQWELLRTPAAERNAAPAERSRIVVRIGTIVLLALVVGGSSVLVASSGDAASPAPGFYVVNRQISDAGARVTLFTVLVRQDGKAVFSIAYEDTGTSPLFLTCQEGKDSLSLTTVKLGDGRLVHPKETYCSDYPGQKLTLLPDLSVLSYAIFPDARDLGQSFTFHWAAGNLSGTISGVSLAA
jgi:hypothetical protein